MSGKSHLLDMSAIADRLDYPVNTVRVWRKRGLLPDPVAELAIGPVWNTSDIDKWTDETGRRRDSESLKPENTVGVQQITPVVTGPIDVSTG